MMVVKEASISHPQQLRQLDEEQHTLLVLAVFFAHHCSLQLKEISSAKRDARRRSSSRVQASPTHPR